MSRKVQKKKQPVKQKQSQRQSQNVVVNVIMAKHTARRKPSGKKAIPIATPILQPPIRMNVSYGDILQREQPKREILGEEFRKILAEEIAKSKPVAELREDFLSRISSKPKDRLIPPPLYDFESGFEEPTERPTEEKRSSENVFEPRYDGATLEMLIRGDYGVTQPSTRGAGGNPRRRPTTLQKQILEAKGYLR